MRAYDKLVAMGYLEPRRGAGFFVKWRREPPAPRSKQWGSTAENPGRWQQLLRQAALRPNPGDGVFPDEWMDHGAVMDALRSLNKLPTGALGGYADPQGYLPLRQQLHIKLAEQGIHASAQQIVTTSGAIDALHLTIWSHLLPEQMVAIEDPAPFIYVQRLMASGLNVVKVPRLKDGPDIEALRNVCEQHKPRAFICSSVLQNPTSTNLSPQKAHQILKIAEAHDLLVIDDDTYGDLLPAATSGTSRLATLDQFERVIHLGSFSKTIAPALRSGFIAASPDRINRILLYKSVGAIHGPLLNERIVYRILSEGRYRHHCEQLQGRLRNARKILSALLSSIGCDAGGSGTGLYLWASLGAGVDAAEIADRLGSAGLQMAPGSAFSSLDTFRTHMRFNIAATQPSHVVALSNLLERK